MKHIRGICLRNSIIRQRFTQVTVRHIFCDVPGIRLLTCQIPSAVSPFSGWVSYHISRTTDESRASIITYHFSYCISFLWKQQQISHYFLLVILLTDKTVQNLLFSCIFQIKFCQKMLRFTALSSYIYKHNVIPSVRSAHIHSL